MDTPKIQPSTGSTKDKFIFKPVLIAILGIVFFIIGFATGKMSTLGRNKSVLGAQTSNSVSSRLLALLFNFDFEKPSQQINTLQLAPTGQQPTTEPSPTPEDDGPSMIWSGINRNPQPSSTPTPNNVITVPEPTVDDQAPTPTPQYKYDWGRNNPSTPTPNKMKVETPMEVEATLSGIVKTPSKTSIVPIEVQNFIEGAGAQIDGLQIIKKEGETGVHVSGELRERLFGFLTVGYPISIKVDQDMGTIESVSIPWWRTLFGNPFAGNITKIRCGDGICNSSESYITCKADCAPVCGNGICEYGEGQDTCPADCEILPTITPVIGQ